MIFSFSSLSLYAASKNIIDNLEKFECHFFEDDKSTDIKNPFPESYQPYRWCHMLNQSTR